MTASTAPGSSRPWTVFYWYTVWSVLAVVAMMPFFALVATREVDLAELGAYPLLTTLLTVQVLASAAAVGVWLESWRRRVRLRRWVPLVAALPAAVALGVLVAQAPSGGGSPEASAIALVTVVAGCICLHAPLRWWTVIPTAAGVVVLGVVAGLDLNAAMPVGSFLLAILIVVRSSLWMLQLVRAVDDARAVEGRLALAEERLRFSRDLHDVMGRDLSSIAVTAELVSQLADRDDPRAAEHARSIATTARSSLAEVRALVRGYRDADLAAELQGTLSLMRSAGITTHLRGEAADVPPEHAKVATWALREAGTNVLRHADATTVTVALDADGLSVVNDGAREPAATSAMAPASASAPPSASASPPPNGVPAGTPTRAQAPSAPRANSSADGQEAAEATDPPASEPIAEGSGLTGLRERIGPKRGLSVTRRGDTVELHLRFTSEEDS